MDKSLQKIKGNKNVQIKEVNELNVYYNENADEELSELTIIEEL